MKNWTQRRDEYKTEGFNHPCMETCSGWKQGYEKGFDAGRADTLKEVMQFLKNINDDAGWWYADKIEKELK